jgi:D-beta-D-heptose 7-phosphate kinase/D-beta-D-heptose 1-phosphate adenosyltransferase
MFESSSQVLAAVRRQFDGRRVLVVGDVMLDRYIWGAVRRISPEAPVPVVQLTSETEVPGGAANVARNLAGLGLEVELAGVTGSDAARTSLMRLLAEAAIDTNGLRIASDRGTTTKTRVIGNHQQMMRIDSEHSGVLADVDSAALLDAVAARLPVVDALILSDYAKGVLTGRLCAELIAVARAHGVPVLVDPKGRDFTRYAGATAITPNRAELTEACGVDAGDQAALLAAGAALRAQLGLETLAVTLSEQGMALIDALGTHLIPAVAKEVFDVSGAGDTVIATFAAALAAGLVHRDAAHLANLAAGVVVGKVGTAVIETEDLLAAISDEAALEQAAKIRPLPTLIEQARRWQAAGERVVFTNGCFDLLHVGHVSYLERARRHGHRLIVGLNTDRSVRALKGAGRPMVGEADRARILAALAAVDAVVLFDEPTPLALIEALRPDILAKGADYREEDVVGAEEVRGWGGQVVLVPLVAGRSTTALVDRLRVGDRSMRD